MSWSDPVLASKTRDAVATLTRRIITQERPPFRYGEVMSIDTDLFQCEVQFPNEAAPVPVRYGGVRPTAIGQIVQVATAKAGDSFIISIVGQSLTSEPPPAELDAPLNFTLDGGFNSLIAAWDTVTGASKYDVQVSESSDFTVAVRTFETMNNVFQFGNIEPGVTHWGRARAKVTAGVGPWSNTATAQAIEPTASEIPTDGQAPSVSPTPTGRGGIGFIIVEWNKIANNDDVTYEVHVSLVSGFTPSASTLAGETTSNFMHVSHLPNNGGRVPYNQNIFFRIIAKDRDGSAPWSAQGFTQAIKVETGDVGLIDPSHVTDGQLPNVSAPTAALTGGPKYIYAKWDHVFNPDPITYEVHISSGGANFTPNSNTLVAETPSNFVFIRRVGPGAGGGELQYGVTYYVKIWPKDKEGYGTAPGSAPGVQCAQVTGPDIVAGAITAGSAIIADAAIGNAKISNLSASKLIAGTIDASIINVINLNASNITAGTLHGGYIQAGTLNVTNAEIASLSAAKITGGVIGAESIWLSSSQFAFISSYGYNPGVSGWRIRGDGFAEFAGVTVRGFVVANQGFKTAESGQRIEITSSQGLGVVALYDSSGIMRGRLQTYSSGVALYDYSGYQFSIAAGQLFTNASYMYADSAQISCQAVRGNAFYTSYFGGLEMEATTLVLNRSGTTSSLRGVGDPNFGQPEIQVRQGYGTFTYRGIRASYFAQDSSAERKRDVVPFQAKDALARIKGKRNAVNKFRFSEGNIRPDGTIEPGPERLGFITEELPPEAQFGGGFYMDAVLALCYGGLLQLSDEVDQLKQALQNRP